MSKSIFVKIPNQRTISLPIDYCHSISEVYDSLVALRGWKSFTLSSCGQILKRSESTWRLENGQELSVNFPILGGGTKTKVTIQTATANHEEKTIEIDSDMTGFQVKQLIYSKVTQTLDVGAMKLIYAGVEIQNDKKMSYYKFVEKDSVFKIIQSKMSLEGISNVIIAYEPDDFLGDQVSARMPCGHVIGQSSMTQLVRSLISANKYEIKCPSYKANGEECEMLWEYPMCKRIGVFTMEELQQFEKGLSLNWFKQFTSECPSCKFPVYKGELQSNRVVCPNCGFGDFCYVCLRKWKDSGFKICGNQECDYINDFLKASIWDKPFKLKENGVDKQYLLPRERGCPKCRQIIQHKAGCKHVKCAMCKEEFCWVCLEVAKNGKYGCGSWDQYCGKVAQTQQFST